MEKIINYLKTLSKKFLNLVLEHRLIVYSTLLLYLFLALPILLFPFQSKDLYRGINIPHTSIGNPDSLVYLSVGKEVLGGNHLGNPALREGKDNPNTNFSMVEYIILSPIKLLGLANVVDVVTLYNFYSFIFVFVISFLIYSFIFRLSKDKILSTITVLFIIGGYTIIKNKMFGSSEANMYLRPTQPAANIMILFTYLHCLLNSIKSSGVAARKQMVLSGAVFGLMFYVGFFVWTFSLAVTVVLFLLSLFFKKDISLSKRLLGAMAIGFLIGLYQLLHLYWYYGSDLGGLASFFFGKASSHFPIFHRLPLLVTMLLCIIFSYKFRREAYFWLFLAIIIGSWAALNQQVVTGILLYPDHYDQYFIIPLSTIISFYILWFLVKNQKLRLALAVLIATISLSNIFLGQFRNTLELTERRLYEQKYRGVLDFLGAENKPGVILTNENSLYNMLFNVYTLHDLFWTSSALQFSTPNLIQRIQESLCVYLYLDEDTRGDISSVGKNTVWTDLNPEHCCRDTYQALEAYETGLPNLATYRQLEASNDPFIAQSKASTKANLLSTCQHIAGHDEQVTGILKKYGVNYIVWDKNLNPYWDLSFLRDYKQVYSDQDIYLYHLEN